LAVRISALNLDCQKCTTAQKVERGCEEDSPIPGKWKVDENSYQRCPLKIITQQSLDYLDAYELLEMHILPHGKGWLNESKKFMDAMRLIRSEVLKIKLEANKKANGRK
jgi:hypothetical protein